MATGCTIGGMDGRGKNMDFEMKIKGIQWHGPEKTTVHCLECELKKRGLTSWKQLSAQITLDISSASNRGLLEDFPVDVLIEAKKATADTPGDYVNLEPFYRLVCEGCSQPLISTAYRYTYILNGHTRNYKSANKSKLVSAYMQAVEQPDFVWAVVFDEITGATLCWNDKGTEAAKERVAWYLIPAGEEGTHDGI